MADYKVILSRRADNMLITHTEFLAKVSPVAARKLLADFRKATKVLEASPFQYPFAEEMDAQGIPAETYRECLFESSSGHYKRCSHCKPIWQAEQ